MSAQHNAALLGGNLKGRLALAQGAVVAELQAQLASKDDAIAASGRQLAALQARLEQLAVGLDAKLAAEAAERERLGAEAAQARLLCLARGRQLGTLQQELQQLTDAAAQQQDAAGAAAGLQQQQLEQLHQRLADAQQAADAARAAAADVAAQAAAAEGGKAGLRQQVGELQAALADKQLQVEWLEGKVADLESSDVSAQVCGCCWHRWCVHVVLLRVLCALPCSAAC